MTDAYGPEYLWEHEFPHAQHYGYLLRIEQHSDARWSATFDRMDTDKVWVFWAATEERLLMQVQMTLGLIDWAVRGLARRAKDGGNPSTP